MEEMGKGLAGGKPFLGNREVLPAGAVDVPGHLRRHLIGGLSLPSENADDFPYPAPMVLLQFSDPPAMIQDEIPMSREGQPDVVGCDLVQALEKLVERVAFAAPSGDVRGDGVEDVVSRKQDLGLR